VRRKYADKGVPILLPKIQNVLSNFTTACWYIFDGAKMYKCVISKFANCFSNMFRRQILLKMSKITKVNYTKFDNEPQQHKNNTRKCIRTKYKINKYPQKQMKHDDQMQNDNP
jgi:hypothetical protein